MVCLSLPKLSNTDLHPIGTTRSPQHFWRWIFSLQEDKMADHYGLDHYLFLCYLRLILRLFVPIALTILPILVSVNAVNGKGEEFSTGVYAINGSAWSNVTGLNQLAWSNVRPTASNRYWAHLLLAVLLVTYCCYMLFNAFSTYAKLRSDKMAALDQEHTETKVFLLICNMAERTKSELTQLYGVEDSFLFHEKKTLKELLLKRIEHILKLESTITELVRYYSRHDQFPEECLRVKQRACGNREVIGRISNSQKNPQLVFTSEVQSSFEKDVILDVQKRFGFFNITQDLGTSTLDGTIDSSSRTANVSETFNDENKNIVDKRIASSRIEDSSASWCELTSLSHSPLDRHDQLCQLIDFHCRTIDTLTNQIESQSEKEEVGISYISRLRNRLSSRTPTALISFNSYHTARLAMQSFHQSNPYQNRVYNCQDVEWNNVGIPWWERYARSLAVTVATTFLTIAWTIPIAIAGLLSRIPRLGIIIPSLSVLQELPGPFIPLIQGVLSPLALSMLLWLIPLIFRTLARLEGFSTHREVELAIQSYSFRFLFFQTFLIVPLSTTFTSIFEELKQSVQNLPNILATNLPKASNYFFSYIVVQALGTTATVLLQPERLFDRFITGKLFDHTPREKLYRHTKTSEIALGTLFPVYTNLAIIGQ